MTTSQNILTLREKHNKSTSYNAEPAPNLLFTKSTNVTTGKTMKNDDSMIPTEKGNRETGVTVTGKVTEPVFFNMQRLRAMPLVRTEDQPLICGDGDPKGRTGQCRGVLLTDLITETEVLVFGHNDTKKMIVVAAADDGYMTIFSWQEIFNTATGEGILVILEKDGRPLYEDFGDIDLFSANDFLTGPRTVQRLRTIEIRMVE